MTLTAINPPGQSWPGVSMGVLDRATGLFASTGHVGTGPDGDPVMSSAEDQVVALFENLKATLAAAGLGFQHVVQMKSYVKSYDPEFMSAFRAVRLRYFNPRCPPASVMVQAGLYDERLLVEAEVLAVGPGREAGTAE
ncbi:MULTISPECIES: RidA family protein [Paracoccaceae]|jgi:enamine deaminase RidA (YjgF/YER057c/UK114 family)|uniref:RidA family protein n=1 Tax=Paracoccaceae TaxID=31989 RepID=UPI0030755F55